MKIKRLIVFTSGLSLGYLAGTAAGRERFDQIRSGAAALAADLGLAQVGEHLRLRSGEAARASLDRAAESACDGIDAAAGKIDDFVAPTEPLSRSYQGTGPDQVPSELARANGSPHNKNKGNQHG
jgi:hypothetical protein